jgi:hypothetical protein
VAFQGGCDRAQRFDGSRQPGRKSCADDLTAGDPDPPTRRRIIGDQSRNRSSTVQAVFIERVTAPRAEFDEWEGRLRLVSEPPAALVASFAWEMNGEVTAINVWDSPDAIADFFVERVHKFVEQHGPPANKPQRLGPPLRAYVRPTS